MRPMGGFGLPEHVRITIGTREENERLLRRAAQAAGEPRERPRLRARRGGRARAARGLGGRGGARGAGVARRVVGVARQRETAAAALRAGIVDEAGTELEALVAGAELRRARDAPRRDGPRCCAARRRGLAEGCIVTDVGSVKGSLGETLAGPAPAGRRSTSARTRWPGSHRRGLDHARADLFEGAACVVAPAPGTPPAAVARVRGFFEALGARVRAARPRGATTREVAWVSHLPHALAFAYARAARGRPGRRRRRCAGRASATSPASPTATPSSGPRSCAPTARRWPGPLARAARAPRRARPRRRAGRRARPWNASSRRRASLSRASRTTPDPGATSRKFPFERSIESTA